jgi:hypothetical protein
MPRKRPSAPDQIEQDFLDALDRLKAGRPQNPKLREKVRKGKPVKISISTVAQEAGRARGLIALENCRYPRIRQLVLIESGVPGVEPGNRDDVIANLRAQVAELRTQLADANDHAAYHLDLRTRAERKAADYQSRYERLRRQVDGDLKRGKDRVVALFPEQEGDGDAE